MAKPSRGASKRREPSFKGGALSPVAPRLRTPHAKAPSGRSDKRRRFSLARLIYWGAVLAIWAVLTVAGLFTWVGLHLPSSESDWALTNNQSVTGVAVRCARATIGPRLSGLVVFLVNVTADFAFTSRPIFLPAQESESDRSGAMDCNLRLWYCRR